MPKILGNYSDLLQKSRVGKIEKKNGSQMAVFLDQEDMYVSAFYKKYVDEFATGMSVDSSKNIIQKRGNEVIRLIKQEFWIHKILCEIYPDSFAKWSFSGMNSKLESGSRREKILGKASYESDELVRIKKKFKLSNLNIGLDFGGLNVIEDEKGNGKYVDTVNIFIHSSEDIDRILDICDSEILDRKKLESVKTNVRKWGRRIIEIEKEEYEIKNGKVILKNQK